MSGAVRHVAHQLRQPLSTIEAIAYYLSITLPPTEVRALEQVEKLQRLVQEASNIVSDAVQFFQTSPVRPLRVQLNEFLTDVVADMLPAEMSRLSVMPGPDDLPVRLDLGQAAHMLRSLTNYFRQISPDEAPIRVRTSAACGEAVLAIGVESACCTASEVLALLDVHSIHLGSGSGLAMASVRRIIDVHDGRVEVRGKPPAELLLTVFFPLAS
ncbi:MAG: hypothetical protein HY822_17360 [Acidobacteria bacterium]|nr:hypothetical protein [Acidobacteriota bacterium]